MEQRASELELDCCDTHTDQRVRVSWDLVIMLYQLQVSTPGYGSDVEPPWLTAFLNQWVPFGAQEILGQGALLVYLGSVGSGHGALAQRCNSMQFSNCTSWYSTTSTIARYRWRSCTWRAANSHGEVLLFKKRTESNGRYDAVVTLNVKDVMTSGSWQAWKSNAEYRWMQDEGLEPCWLLTKKPSMGNTHVVGGIIRTKSVGTAIW